MAACDGDLYLTGWLWAFRMRSIFALKTYKARCRGRRRGGEWGDQIPWNTTVWWEPRIRSKSPCAQGYTKKSLHLRERLAKVSKLGYFSFLLHACVIVFTSGLKSAFLEVNLRIAIDFKCCKISPINSPSPICKMRMAGFLCHLCCCEAENNHHL